MTGRSFHPRKDPKGRGHRGAGGAQEQRRARGDVRGYARAGMRSPLHAHQSRRQRLPRLQARGQLLHPLRAPMSKNQVEPQAWQVRRRAPASVCSMSNPARRRSRRRARGRRPPGCGVMQFTGAPPLHRGRAYRVHRGRPRGRGFTYRALPPPRAGAAGDGRTVRTLGNAGAGLPRWGSALRVPRG